MNDHEPRLAPEGETLRICMMCDHCWSIPNHDLVARHDPRQSYCAAPRVGELLPNLMPDRVVFVRVSDRHTCDYWTDARPFTDRE